jgi:YHS domain-containing protein
MCENNLNKIIPFNNFIIPFKTSKTNFMKKLISFFIGTVLLASCSSQASQTTKESSSAQPAAQEASMNTTMSDTTKYTAAMVDNAKDPVCGMPVAAEVGDTVHYNNKVIGFCSKECRDEFMKDAKKSFTSVEWKKTK